jgi:glycogen operon protein
VTLPSEEYAAAWDVCIDTGGTVAGRTGLAAGSVIPVQGASVVVLIEHHAPEAEPDVSAAASVAALAEQQD